MSGTIPASGADPEPEAAVATEAGPASEATPPSGAAPAAPRPGMLAEAQEPAGRTPGWREVLLVSAAVVLLVLGASVVTGFLPTDVQRLVFHEPLLIGFLVLGTILVLWSVARRRPPA